VAEPTEIQNKLEELFQGITNNLSKRKEDFESLKRKSQSELSEMHKTGELQQISKDWQREMELHLNSDQDKSG
jgi:Skp family chaperone for outer membrane proteins